MPSFSMNTPSSLKDFPGTIHLVSSSHWDREWYFSFQKFRGKLVGMLDQVFSELESGRLPFYQLDGQFIPVEDYLQIRPEKEALVRSLVAAGRFKVGPWYNLPDEFLVSGESLVRNFLLGMERAEAFGQTSRVGWLCDIFGHNSQMPQILSKLRINNAILWRGVDLSQGPLFHWEGADGSRIIVHCFPENGYTDFDFDVRSANKPDVIPGVEGMVANALTYLEKTSPGPEARPMLWFDGGDHMEFDPAILEMAQRLNALAGRELIRVSTLDAFIEALCKELPPSLPTVKGELREPAAMETYGWLIPGVGSSRIPLKQANHAGETLLTLWLEHWCAAASAVLGLEYPRTAITLAWEYLLKNHPHDSICGCSPDETHDAMPYRFEQSRQIAEYYLDRALGGFSAASLRGQVAESEIGLSLFAPAGGTVQLIPEVSARLPKDWPQFSEFFGFESKPSLRVYDLEGNEVAYQLLQVLPSTTHLRIPRNHFPSPEERQGIRIALDTSLEPREARHFVLRRASGPTRIAPEGAIGVARNQLRNEFLEITASSEGTLSLKDLQTGGEYHGLLAMEDTADIGDGWFHGVALQDRAYLSTGGNVSFGLTENGPLLARLHLRVEWLVPESFDFQRNERSGRLVPFVVEHHVTLRKGQAHAEVETTIHNHVRDHRLRLLCPTGLQKAESFWSDTPFDAVERPVKLREGNHLLREIQVEMTPQQNWVAISDGHRGLALIAPGQYESAVLDQPDRPLCVTLLRAFRRAVFTDGNEGGQIQGIHRLRLALKPLGATPPGAELFRLAQSVAAPVRSLYLDAADLRAVAAPALVPSGALPKVEGDVVLSASFRGSEASWFFRVFNPAAAPAEVTLSGATAWYTTNLRGERVCEVTGERLTLGAKEILTLCATF